MPTFRPVGSRGVLMMVGRPRWLVLLVLSGCRMGFDNVPMSSPDGSLPLDDGSPPDGLVVAPIASWNLDGGSGQTVVDSSGNGFDGVLGTSAAIESSDPIWVATPPRICSGSGLTFDGTNDVVTVPGPSQANLSKFSISFSLFATGAGGNQLARIVSKEEAVPDVIVHYRVADDAIAVNMFNTADTLFATFGSGVVLDQRANWVVSFDDTGDRRVHIYKNGAEVSYVRQDPMTGTLRTTTNAWTIGNVAAGIRALDGTLDAIRIYDTKLDANEISALSALCPP
jgi:hypothetical protein